MNQEKFKKGVDVTLATTNQLPPWLQSLCERITIDFGLETHPPAEKAEMLGRLSSMVLTGAVMRADELLNETDSKHVDNILEGMGESEPERAMKAILYIATRVPEFDTLIDTAYEEVKALAIKVNEEDREKKFKDADEMAEAVGDAFELGEDVSEAAAVDVPGLSVVGIGVDLLLDPARFRRSASERQTRFFKHVAILCGKALAVLWSGLLFFTILDALERRQIISSIPEIFRAAIPNWYEKQSMGGQILLLAGLAAGFTLVGFIVVLLAARAGASPRLTSAFELKVSDDELASTTLKALLLPSLYPSGVPQDTLWRTCQIIYRSIYASSGRPNSDDLKILDEILKGGNEKAAVAFLKSKVRRYRSAMQDEAERFCSDAAEIMERIK